MLIRREFSRICSYADFTIKKKLVKRPIVALIIKVTVDLGIQQGYVKLGKVRFSFFICFRLDYVKVHMS